MLWSKRSCFAQELVCGAFGGLLTSVGLFQSLMLADMREDAEGPLTAVLSAGHRTSLQGGIENNELFYCLFKKLGLIRETMGILKEGKRNSS